jgi:hypothetical protein
MDILVLGGAGKFLSGTCENAELSVSARGNFYWRPVVQSFPNFMLIMYGT